MRLDPSPTGPETRVLLASGAFFTGLAAGGMLFAATVYNTHEDAGPGAMAAIQALGVFVGSFVSLPFCNSRRLPACAGLFSLCAAVSCLLLILSTSQSFAPFVVALVGLAVGLAVATTDSLAAVLDGPGKSASTILKAALFGALGATVAPILVQAAVTGGQSSYVVSGGALALASVSWIRLGSAGLEPETLTPRRWSWPCLRPAMALAFLFGFVDNGILSLAASHFYRTGASGWTVAAIGLAAGAGAAIVQLAAVFRLEGKSGKNRTTLFYVMALAGFCLVAGSLGLKPLMAGILLVTTGILIDVIYGLGLVETLQNNKAHELSGAATGYMCACALGEVVGPLASDFAGSQNMMNLLFLLPAALLAISMVALIAKSQRAAGVNPC